MSSLRGAFGQGGGQIFFQGYQPFVRVFGQVNHAKTTGCKLLDDLITTQLCPEATGLASGFDIIEFCLVSSNPCQSTV